MDLHKLKVDSYILYEADNLPSYQSMRYEVKLVRMKQKDGADKWAIYNNQMVLYKDDKEFGFESMPSSRTTEDLKATRFDSAEDALDFWVNQVQDKYNKDITEQLAQLAALRPKHS